MVPGPSGFQNLGDDGFEVAISELIATVFPERSRI